MVVASLKICETTSGYYVSKISFGCFITLAPSSSLHQPLCRSSSTSMNLVCGLPNSMSIAQYVSKPHHRCLFILLAPNENSNMINSATSSSTFSLQTIIEVSFMMTCLIWQKFCLSWCNCLHFSGLGTSIRGTQGCGHLWLGYVSKSHLYKC